MYLLSLLYLGLNMVDFCIEFEYGNFGCLHMRYAYFQSNLNILLTTHFIAFASS